MLDIFLNVLGAITPLFLAYLGFHFKIKLKRMEVDSEDKKQKSELEYNELLEKLEQIENKTTEMDKILELYISDNKFRIDFKNEIRIRSRKLYSIYENTLPCFDRNVLLKWAVLIENFGLDFFHSEQRKESAEKRKEYLTIILNSYIAEFYDIVESVHPETKKWESRQIKISEFLKGINIHSETEHLKITLVKNGLSKEDIINLFADYIIQFSKSLSTAFQNWNKLI